MVATLECRAPSLALAVCTSQTHSVACPSQSMPCMAPGAPSLHSFLRLPPFQARPWVAPCAAAPSAPTLELRAPRLALALVQQPQV